MRGSDRGRPVWPVRRLRHIGAKLAGAVTSQVAVLVAAFLLFRVLPGDPVRAMTRGRPINATQLANLRAELGVDDPLPSQFATYVGLLLHGDLGTSFQYRLPVADLIGARLGATVALVGTATVLAAVTGLWSGAWSAWYAGGVVDRVGTAAAVTLWSVPTFWLGLVLLAVFGGGLGPLPGLFPTGGIETPGVSGFGPVALDRLWHLTLPCLTLTAVIHAQYLLVMRSSVLAVRDSAFLTTARAKGLSDAAVRRRHAVPNAYLPSATLIALNLGGVVSGAVVVETVFSWPGLGSLFYEALTVPDLPLLQGLFLTITSAVIVMNLLADLSYPLLDPRVEVA